MEKIYMEDSSSQSKKSKQARRELGLSVVLSFVVAFFAIFSLIACGIDQISYAAPQVNPPSGDFTFYQGDTVKGFDTNNTENYLVVNLYYSDSTNENPIFCIEHHNERIDNGQTVYTRDKKITDNGLVYILEHSYVNGVNIFYNGVSAPNAQTEDYVESWATQAAIWYYLYLENGGVAGGEGATITSDNVNYMSLTQVKGLENANTIQAGGTNINVSGLGAKVVQFVNDVRANHKNAVSHDFSIVNVDQELDDQGHPKYTLTEDGQYYQSNVFSMTSNDNPVSYTVTLTGTVEGAFICDASGNPITGALNPEDSFYVRIPVSSVSENESKHVNVNVKAQFNLFAGYEFKGSSTTNTTVLPADHQRVVSLVNEKVTNEHDDVLEIIGAPDTSMTTAQTIYFIGLVVLLCGIGIVYANAKPAQSKQ